MFVHGLFWNQLSFEFEPGDKATEFRQMTRAHSALAVAAQASRKQAVSNIALLVMAITWKVASEA